MTHYISIAVAAVLALALSHQIGSHSAQVACERARADAVERALEEQARTLHREHAAEIEALRAEKRTEVVYETIYRAIPESMPAHQRGDSQCNLARGTVGLLNHAAAGTELPPGPVLSDGEASTASTVTQHALAIQCAGWAEQYNLVAGRYGRLITLLEGRSGVGN